MQERWKPCPHFETTHEVSDLGRVRSVARTIQTKRGPRRLPGTVLAPDYTHQSGYARVKLNVNGTGTWKTVHGLVARAFHGPPPGPVGSRRGEWTIDHLDGDKTNNRADNLEWVSSDENRRRYVARGTIRQGVDHHNAKLTPAAVREIRRLRGQGRTYAELGERFGVSAACAWEAAAGRRVLQAGA